MHLRHSLAWVDPLVSKIPADTFARWLAIYPPLNEYALTHRQLMRDEAHILPEDKEKLVGLFDDGFFAFTDSYDALMELDTPIPSISIGDSNVPLSLSAYSAILEEQPDRVIRRAASASMSQKYTSKKETIANLMGGSISMEYGYARAYNYSSCLEYYTDSYEIPVTLYENLINKVKKSTRPLQKYHQLRAKALNLEDYSGFDARYNLFKPQATYTIPYTKTLLTNALSPLGTAYLSRLDTMFGQRHIDFYETPHKVNNVAYSISYYGNAPFILTNFSHRLTDVFTLAHELGHAVHGMYACQSQPLSTAESSIFVDEVTSTLNELLLTDYLLNTADIGENRLYLLQWCIDNIEYYFRSALKADFAYQVYQYIESGEMASAKHFDKLYARLMNDYYGSSLVLTDSSGWCRYGLVDFYDYQYVTSMTASILLYEKLKADTSGLYLSRYETLLRAGGDDFPLRQLSKAGIDLLDDQNYQALSRYLAGLVAQYEAELKRQRQL